MSSYTRKDLNQKSVDYVSNKIKEGYKVRHKSNDSECKETFFNLEKKIGKNEVWNEWISYGIDRNGDFSFCADIRLNNRQKDLVKWKCFNAYDKVFADTREEADDLWLKKNC